MSEEVMRWSLHQVPATKAPKMLERRDGMWVLHEDHQKALIASQARLSEAVKVLEEATQALEPFAEAEDGYPHFREDNEYADQHEFQIRDLRLAKGSLSRAKAFLATLGEEGHDGEA